MCPCKAHVKASIAGARATKAKGKTVKLIKLSKRRIGLGGVLGLLALGGLLLGAQPAASQSCITEQAGRSLVCTANDIQVAFADNVRDTSGTSLTQCISGQTFSFVADFHVTTTASTRYDIGLYFATDGDPNGDGA